MANATHNLDPLAETDRHLCLLAGARAALDVVQAVRDYLAAWPAERIALMQRVDAGWAPFDENQKPAFLYRPEDVLRSYHAVHGQCLCLRAAGMALPPEILELERYFYFASVKLAEFEPQLPADSRAMLPNSRGDRQSGPGPLGGPGHPA